MVLNIISDLYKPVAISQLISKGSGNLVLCVLSWVKVVSYRKASGHCLFLSPSQLQALCLSYGQPSTWLAGERHLELLLFGHHVMSYNCRSYKMDHNSLPR